MSTWSYKQRRSAFKHAKPWRDSPMLSSAISAAVLCAHTAPPHVIHPSIHCKKLKRYVSMWVRQSERVNLCMRTAQVKSSTIKGPDENHTKVRRVWSNTTLQGYKVWVWRNREWLQWLTEDRNLTGSAVRLASVDAAHAEPIHNAATWIVIKRNFAILVLDSEWMMTSLNHICQLQKVQPLQTLCSTWTVIREINIDGHTMQPYTYCMESRAVSKCNL